MPDGKTLTEYRLKAAEDRIGDLSQELTKMRILFERRERERAIEERKKLWAGITTLGGVVMTLLGIIWTFRGVIFRDGQQ